jgi:hypothetical protein
MTGAWQQHVEVLREGGRDCAQLGSGAEETSPSPHFLSPLIRRSAVLESCVEMWLCPKQAD